LESQALRFIGRELEHEIGREPVEVAFHRFVQIAAKNAGESLRALAARYAAGAVAPRQVLFARIG
jgi:hypothetical protein